MFNNKNNYVIKGRFKMEITEIIKDAFHYPISDFKKFLVLGIPILILSVLFFVLILQAVGLSEIANLPAKSLANSPLFSTFIITTLIFFVALIIGVIIIEGIQISIIRESINNNDILPSLEPVKNFVDGIKGIVLQIIYMFIPITIYMIILLGVASLGNDFAVVLVLILSVIAAIVFFILSAMYIVALGRFTETNSISEALQFGSIYDTARNIGLGKIIIVILVTNIISSFISLIGMILVNIPIIGFFIMTYILYNFFIMFNSRCYALLYRDRFENNNTGFNQNTMNNNYNNELNNYQNNNLENNPNNQYDFQPKKIDSSEENVSINLKKCNQCGYSNPDYANICGNCGNEL